MSKRKRVDANQAEIVDGLRKLGVFVEPRLARIGDGVPDLLYCHRGVWGVAEVKADSKSILTIREVEWWDDVPVKRIPVWTSLDDARKTLGL